MRKKIFKVMILGDSGVGKTSILEQYVNKSFAGTYKVTIGADFLNKDLMLGSEAFKLQIWDTAGQEKYRSLGLAYYRGADACMFVFDVTDVRTFNNLGAWVETFFSEMPEKQTESFPIVIVGNKTDKPGRTVSQEMARKWCHAHGGFSYFEVSAKSAAGIDPAFEKLTSLTAHIGVGDV